MRCTKCSPSSARWSSPGIRCDLHVLSRTPITPFSQLQFRSIALTSSNDSCCVPCQVISVDMVVTNALNNGSLHASVGARSRTSPIRLVDAPVYNLNGGTSRAAAENVPCHGGQRPGPYIEPVCQV